MNKYIVILALMTGLSVFSAAPAKDAQSISQDGFVFGLNGHALYQIPDKEINFVDQITLLKKAHAGIYRFDVPSHPDFQVMDKIVDQLNQNNIIPLPVINPPGTRSRTISPEEAEKEAYAYAAILVQRYKDRVRYWELGNELDNFCILKRGDVLPNGKIYQFGTASGWSVSEVDEKRYQIALGELRGLSRGIREGDATAKLIVDAAGWVHVGFLDKLQQDKLDFDIVGWHWYADYGDIHKVDGKPLLDHLVAYHKPIWITEGGSRVDAKNPANEKIQADYTEGSMESFSGLYPLVQVYCIYTLFDSKAEPIHDGIISVENPGGHGWEMGKPKPAFDVMCNFIPE